MTSPHPLTCQELVELVTDYLEGTLPAEDHAHFEDHLGRCPGCQMYLDQVRTTIALTGRLTEERLPEDAREHLLAAFRTWKSRR
jgi:predicted anti-sigma-YlaC factor YlaD